MNCGFLFPVFQTDCYPITYGRKVLMSACLVSKFTCNFGGEFSLFGVENVGRFMFLCNSTNGVAVPILASETVGKKLAPA
ncbi:hypothetical protein NIES2119_25700 [[Phormidium ambiguum] IAM M-71]|uniref:Uncharacterized protein n=1 Tax=[Phormidium ambiguum] IAM M-71 TaxID=454136 RepID=A0A1U7I821_9CYAN|nr:hypothetical protein NIES2119_25700 [Phormidium ambiguum IAM M-71]